MTSALEQRFRALLADPSFAVPLPATGETLSRWRVLSSVAAEDLALAKVFEGHTDALAILEELAPGHAGSGGDGWGVWAAEPPDARLGLTGMGAQVTLEGRKAWCSGAGLLDRALVTAWDEQGRQCLAAVELNQPGVTISDAPWQAVGMGRVPTPDVLFSGVTATLIGEPGAYTNRPGFWHGGAGLAACWFGGCLPLAQLLSNTVRTKQDPHAAAHLGAVDVALTALRALLIEAATWIDSHPTDNAAEWANRVRSSADLTAQTVLVHVGRGVGAAPLCRDAAIAQRLADLPVFIRQTHAERDLAELGMDVAKRDSCWWL